MRPDPGAIADAEGAEDLGMRADDHALADRRVTLRASGQLGPAERHALIKGAVVPDLGGLADHHPHPMVDEYALADPRPRMDLDTGHHPADMRHEPAGKEPAAQP